MGILPDRIPHTVGQSKMKKKDTAACAPPQVPLAVPHHKLPVSHTRQKDKNDTENTKEKVRDSPLVVGLRRHRINRQVSGIRYTRGKGEHSGLHQCPWLE